jgi:type III pantothenate kinase
MADTKTVSAASEHRLVVDVGNTQSVIGWFSEKGLMKRWRLSTRRDATPDELAFWLRGLLEQGPKTVSQSAMASVVPSQDAAWQEALKEVTDGPVRTLDPVLGCGLALKVDHPAQVGADRLANVLGARALGASEGVVIDLGTATNFDVFQGNVYHGGVIGPGLQSAMRSLVQNAARLAEVTLAWPGTFVGRSTEAALRVGLLEGTVGTIHHILNGILAEMKMTSPTIFLTGGLAEWVRERIPHHPRHEPDITLIGLDHFLKQTDKN